MSFFDDGFSGGAFDFNGDGRVDVGEEFMAYKMYEAVTGDDDDDSEEDDFSAEDEDDQFDDEDD